MEGVESERSNLLDQSRSGFLRHQFIIIISFFGRRWGTCLLMVV